MLRIEKDSRDLPRIDRGPTLAVKINGSPVTAFAGETVAAVLLANGYRIFRRTEKGKHPRSIYCGIGLCFDCLVTIDGITGIRSCITEVHDGMEIEI